MGPTVVGVMPKKKPPQTEFGVKLVALRQQRGFTQVQLAEASGLTQRSISYYETMPGYPAAPAIISPSPRPCASPPTCAGHQSSAQVSFRGAASRGEATLVWRHLRVVAQLPERDQRAVLRLIDSAAKTSKAG